jgi:hypothetical protein
MPDNPNGPQTDDTALVDDADATSVDVTDEDDDGTDPDGADALGDAGKRALDAMKAKWKAERDKRRELETQLSAKPEADGDAAEAIRREALKAANARILRSEIKAAAAGKLADPKDALKFLDLSKFEVDENGEIDSDDVADAIQSLVSDKPYLAAKATRFQGTGDGGAQRKASGPTQLTREDLKGMKPEAIAKAKAEGRLKGLLGHK